MKTALIFGVTGQDGSYLSEHLLALGYRVVGVARRVSVDTSERIRHLAGNPAFALVEGDVTDASCVSRIVRNNAPGSDLEPEWYEIYNLAAQSHVGTSFEQPGWTTQVTYLGCLNILEAVRGLLEQGRKGDSVRFYQASSSEMFGVEYDQDGPGEPKYQDEETRMTPSSPYGVAKLAAHQLVNVYRESYGIFACSGILMNHESPRRGDNFVTRKISKYVASIHHRDPVLSCSTKFHLGNLNAVRDWGHARDYVRAMHLMLQQDEANDFLIATGKAYSVRDFLIAAFGYIGIDIRQNDVFDKYIKIDPALFRPCEVPILNGDASRARAMLDWTPEVSFAALVHQMVQSDIELAAASK